MASGRPRGGSKLTALPSNERDGQEMWSREALEAMDDAFVTAMQRAIASGAEHADISGELSRNLLSPARPPSLRRRAASAEFA
jgi:hypothetical protein